MPRGNSMWDTGSCVEHEKISHGNPLGMRRSKEVLNMAKCWLLRGVGARATWQLSKARCRRERRSQLTTIGNCVSAPRLSKEWQETLGFQD